MIGRTLAHYTVLTKIGEGGMGEVYRAHDTKLNREVALKVLPAKVSGDPQRLELFHREARAVAALNHPNIVTLYSVEEAEGISDLNGNVDEWTVSLFGRGAKIERAEYAYPYRPDDGREDPAAPPEIRRVLRGGSWYRGQVNARTAYRYEALPDFRDLDFGFRVVVG